MSGKLEKLRVEGFDDEGLTKARSGADGKKLQFSTMINPQSYQEEYKAEYVESAVIGNIVRKQFFNRVRNTEFSFKFMVDGTGALNASNASPPKDTFVKEQIILFAETVMDAGSIDEKAQKDFDKRYVKVIWGSFVRAAVCTHFKVDYQMFHPNGNPLRAEIQATFRAYDRA